MENFCNSCNLYVESDRSHCPLCGKCVNEDNLNKARKFNYFPDYKWHKKRKNVATLIVLVSLVLFDLIFCLGEFLFFNQFNIGPYVLVGTAYIYVACILPSLQMWSFSAISFSQVVLTTLLFVFIEFYSNTFGWAINFVIPSFILASSIAIYIVNLSRGYYARSNFYSSLCCVIISSVLFALSLTIFKGVVRIWPTLVSFVVSVVLFITLFVFKRKKIIKGLKKDFNW